MPARRRAIRLRIFAAESDRHGSRDLATAIVERAREMGLAGATLFRGSDGFGSSRRWRSELNVDAGPRQPVIVEIVDSDERIQQFLSAIAGMVESSLVTTEQVTAIMYQRAGPAATRDAT